MIETQIINGHTYITTKTHGQWAAFCEERDLGSVGESKAQAILNLDIAMLEDESARLAIYLAKQQNKQ